MQSHRRPPDVAITPDVVQAGHATQDERSALYSYTMPGRGKKNNRSVTTPVAPKKGVKRNAVKSPVMVLRIDPHTGEMEPGTRLHALEVMGLLLDISSRL